MPWHRSVFHGRGSLTDRYGVFDLPQTVALEACMLGAPDSAFGAQMLQQLLLQYAARLGVVARIGCQVLTQAFATTTDMLNAA